PNRLTAHFMEMVELSYREHASVGHYARKIGVSEDHLSKVCKRQYQIGAKEIIQKRRIREAKTLLLESSYSSKEIAYLVGYEDANYFSRDFKRLTSVTPTEFRQTSANRRQIC
ncbi:MAG: helix-turn-helix transcriptional regulator, partial [Lewinella sp.]